MDKLNYTLKKTASILIFTVLALLTNKIQAQFFKTDSIENKLTFSILPNFCYFDKVVDTSTWEMARIFSLEPQSYLAYNLSDNLYAGGAFSYEIFKSNFYHKKSFIATGIFLKYYFPFAINKKLLNHFHFYTSIEYYRTNYRYVSQIVDTIRYKSLTVNQDYIISNKLNQNKIAIPIGFIFRFKQIFIF
jgi:hypothetical protein